MPLSRSISQTTNISLTPNQVDEVYKGLIQGDHLKKINDDCKEAVTELNTIIQDQNDSLISLAGQLEDYDYALNELQDQRLQQAVELERLNNKKTPWYKHPILYGVVGFITGILSIK